MWPTPFFFPVTAPVNESNPTTGNENCTEVRNLTLPVLALTAELHLVEYFMQPGLF